MAIVTESGFKISQAVAVKLKSILDSYAQGGISEEEKWGILDKLEEYSTDCLIIIGDKEGRETYGREGCNIQMTEERRSNFRAQIVTLKIEAKKLSPDQLTSLQKFLSKNDPSDLKNWPQNPPEGVKVSNDPSERFIYINTRKVDDGPMIFQGAEFCYPWTPGVADGNSACKKVQ